MVFLKTALVLMFLFESISVVSLVEKERKPITKNFAMFIVTVDIVFILALTLIK